MSFVSDKSAIVTVLEGLGYRLLPTNTDITTMTPASHINKGFTLKPLGLRATFGIAQNHLNEARAELVISYTGVSPNDYDANFDLFNDALTAIKTLHSGYEDNPEYRMTEKAYHSYGRVILIIGVEQC